MMHTKEPWSTEESRVYLGRDGGFDLRDCPSPEDNSRRIVVCVNACAGITDDTLENICMISGSLSGRFAEQRKYLNQVEQRSDELLAALERLLDCYSTSNSPDTRMSCWDQARTAIANAKQA